MSYVAIWLQACLHWRCAYFQTLSWNDTILVVDWDILYKLCGSANNRSNGFIFSGKIWWQLFNCNKASSKYHTCSTTTPKYTLPQRLVNVSVRKFIWNINISFLRHRMFTFFYSPARSSVPPNIPLMKLLFESSILGFYSREKAEIKMETFQYRKSRIWEMKEDKYMSNS